MHQHWSEQLADKVISEKKKPYVISGGMTTSGPAHLGTLCEFLFPSTIQKELKKKKEDAEYYFFADILDAFDSVPAMMEEYKDKLEPHLGKPLCYVPDPTGKSKSFGDYFLDEARGMVDKFNVDVDIIRVNEWYENGKFDKHAKFFLENESKAREVMEKTSGRQLGKEWSPIMPICEKCGKIATTIVTKHDTENYEYVCNRDVKYTKGCGFEGKNSISDHKYKIAWRLHWPSWMDIAGTSIEGAGIDHHTKGGSWDTCTSVFGEMFKKDHPIGYRWGFVLFEGKKYSKSKGIGMSVADLLKLLPAELISYAILRPDLQENIDIKTDSVSLLRLMEDFQKSSDFASQDIDKLNRSERKRALAFMLSTEKLKWKSSFVDVLLYYQIYQDWEKVAELLDDKEGVEYLKSYVLEWISMDKVPEDYRFKYQPKKPMNEHVKLFIEALDENMQPLDIHNLVFAEAEKSKTDAKTLFSGIYQTLIGKERGPRLGKLVYAIGVNTVKHDVLG